MEEGALALLQQRAIQYKTNICCYFTKVLSDVSGRGGHQRSPPLSLPENKKTCPSSPRGPAPSSCPRDKCRGVRKESGGRKASHALLIKVGSSGEEEGAGRSAAGFGGLNCFKSQYHKFMNSYIFFFCYELNY